VRESTGESGKGQFVSEEFEPFYIENGKEIPKAKWYNTITL